MRPSDTGRRTFLLGALGATAAITSRPTSAAAQSDVACSPASPFATDTRPNVLERKPIAQTDMNRVALAYDRMKKWDTIHPSDPRGFKFQSRIHADMAAQHYANQIHGCWHFFPWHRAYIYFHERILAWHLGNNNLEPTFRLPVFDWESSPNSLYKPAAYYQQTSTNPLWIASRGTPSATFFPVLSTQYASQITDTTTRFYSIDVDPSNPLNFQFGTAESQPHGTMHVCVGGVMYDPSTAAQDPIFFAHHANIDKLWFWRRTAFSKDVPPYADWANGTSWTFYDENAKCIRVKPTDLLDEAVLKYTYASAPAIVHPTHATAQHTGIVGGKLQVTNPQKAALANPNRQTVLRLENVVLPAGNKQFAIVAQNKGSGNSALMAIATAFGHQLADHKITVSVTSTLLPNAVRLLAAPGDVTLKVVPNEPKPQTAEEFTTLLSALPPNTPVLQASGASLSISE